eukprot:scaffold2095_cov166-Amphora_coffeaeformis.AAC.13
MSVERPAHHSDSRRLYDHYSSLCDQVAFRELQKSLLVTDSVFPTGFDGTDQNQRTATQEKDRPERWVRGRLDGCRVIRSVCVTANRN